MRHLGFSLGFVFLVVSSSSAAGDTVHPDIGVSYGYQGLALRKALSDNTLVYLGAGIGRSLFESSFTFGGSTTTSSGNTRIYGLTTGARYYLSHEKLSDFAQLELSHSNLISSGMNSPVKTTAAILAYGLEYYLDPHLSIEARAGLGVQYTKYGDTQSNFRSRSFNFPVVGTAITYYW